MKDVEPVFGVLQAQFTIVRYPPPLSWFHDEMWKMMHNCVIMQNMMIEDHRKNQIRTHVVFRPYCSDLVKHLWSNYQQSTNAATSSLDPVPLIIFI
jgi:hypothetical protein